MSKEKAAPTVTSSGTAMKQQNDDSSVAAWTWPVYSPESIARRKWTTDDLAHWYARGVHDGRYLGAAAQAEATEGVHTVETPGMRALYEQRQARADLFRERAVLVAASMGKVYADHPGGPVDWDTGKALVPLRRELRVAA